jgi:predicted ester cyclase
MEHLTRIYTRYIDCLNSREIDRLGEFVDEEVDYNGARLGLAGYKAMLENDFREIPDLWFSVQILIASEAAVGSRINFDVTPRGEFFGLQINGRRVSFSENVFYEFEDGRIIRVWSVIDKAAIERQLG